MAPKDDAGAGPGALLAEAISLGRQAAVAKQVLLTGRLWSCTVRASTLLTASTEGPEVPGLPLQADEHQPSGGPDHFRAPRHIIWQTVQGRQPTAPNAQRHLGRLKVFDGIPPLTKKKTDGGSHCLKVARLKPIPKFAYT